MTDFKIGDKVRYTGAKGSVYSGDNVGRTGVITRLNIREWAGNVNHAVEWDDGLVPPDSPYEANLELVIESLMVPLADVVEYLERSGYPYAGSQVKAHFTPKPKRKTVVVEFDAPADENIESLVQQVTSLTEVKYTIKEDN